MSVHRMFAERVSSGLAQHAFFEVFSQKITDPEAFMVRLLNADELVRRLQEDAANLQEADADAEVPQIVLTAEAWLREVAPDLPDDFVEEGRFVVAGLFLETLHRAELERVVQRLAANEGAA